MNIRKRPVCPDSPDSPDSPGHRDSKIPFNSAVSVSAIDDLCRIFLVTRQSSAVGDILVNSRFRGNNSKLSPASLYKFQVGAVYAAMVARVENIIADVGC
jgi:hypothetical protein